MSSKNVSKQNKKKKKNNNQNINYWQQEPFLIEKYAIPFHALQLFQLEAVEQPGKVDYSIFGFLEEDIPTLINMCRDKQLKHKDVQFHILEIIKMLKPKNIDDIKKLVPLFNLETDDPSNSFEEEEDDATWERMEKMYHVMLEIGAPSVEALSPFLLDTTRPQTGLSYVGEVIKKISERDISIHPLVKELFMKAIQNYKSYDPTLNAYILFGLASLKAKESLQIARKVFEDKLVDVDSYGDYGNFLLKMGVDIPVNDPLVKVCRHCNLPKVVHEHNRKQKEKDQFKYSFEMAKQALSQPPVDYRQALMYLQIGLSTQSFLLVKERESEFLLLLSECLVGLERYEEAIYYLTTPFDMIGLHDFDIPSIRSDFKMRCVPFLEKRALLYEKMGEFSNALYDLKKLREINPSKLSFDVNEKIQVIEKQFLSSAVTPTNDEPLPSQSQDVIKKIPNRNGNQAKTLRVKTMKPYIMIRPVASCCESFEDKKDMSVSSSSIVYSSSCHHVSAFKLPDPSPLNSNQLKLKHIPELSDTLPNPSSIPQTEETKPINDDSVVLETTLADPIRSSVDDTLHGDKKQANHKIVHANHDRRHTLSMSRNHNHNPLMQTKSNSIVKTTPASKAVLKSKNAKEISNIKEDFVDRVYAWGDFVATASAATYQVKVWNVCKNAVQNAKGSDQTFASTLVSTLHGHEFNITCIRMNYSTLISASEDRTVRVWNIAEQKENCVIYGHHRFIRCIEFDTSGTTTSLMTASDGAIREFDINTGYLQRSYFIHKSYTDKPYPEILQVKFNSEFLLSCSNDHEVIVFHRPSERVLHRITSFHDTDFISLGPANKLFAFKTTDRIIICDIGSGSVMESARIEDIHTFHLDDQDGILVVGTWDIIYAQKLEIVNSSSVLNGPVVAKSSDTVDTGAATTEEETLLCGYCRKIEIVKGEFKLCGRCRKVAYCSVECQRAHWKAQHKLNCK